VDATVANVGEANGTYVARLVANGEVVDTRTVDVEAGNQQVVRLTHTFEETGEYSLSIGNLSIGEGSVETGHAFELRETTLGADTVHTGEELTVEATVANNGTDEGTYEAQLVAGEEVVETQSVDIPDGEQRVVTFTHTFEAAGEYTLSIEEERVGEVVVQAPATTTIQTGTTETDDTERTIAPLWILLLAAIILLFVLWRRRDDEEEQESEDQRDKQAGNS
jgi:plastocyanin